MKMNEKNYRDYDYQAVVVKKDAENEVVSNYENFGWNVVKKSQHPRYENLIEVEMKRRHFIQNKDDLQFLQVNMENDIVVRGRLKKTKHSKSVITAITLSIIGGLMIVCCLLMIFNVLPNLNIALSIAFGVAGFIVLLAVPFLSYKIVKKENKIFNEREEELSKSIKNYVNEAIKLLGEQDEK